MLPGIRRRFADWHKVPVAVLLLQLKVARKTEKGMQVLNLQEQDAVTGLALNKVVSQVWAPGWQALNMVLVL